MRKKCVARSTSADSTFRGKSREEAKNNSVGGTSMYAYIGKDQSTARNSQFAHHIAKVKTKRSKAQIECARYGLIVAELWASRLSPSRICATAIAKMTEVMIRMYSNRSRTIAS